MTRIIRHVHRIPNTTTIIIIICICGLCGWRLRIGVFIWCHGGIRRNRILRKCV